MYKRLKHRNTEPELMDDLSMGGAELREALQHLRMLNRIFNAAWPTLYGVKWLWRRADKPRRFSILDIGCGSGDVNRQILKWADAKGLVVSITLVDITEEACEEARLFFRDEPRIQVMRGDLFSLQAQQADIVTAGQLFHHFSDEELPEVAKCMLKACRWGVVINDIHRHWIPWTAVWLTTRFISKNRYIRHDGPLSVAKGFRSSDWKRLRQVIRGARLFFTWIPLFRYAVIIRNDKV